MAYVRTAKRENPFVQLDKYFIEDSNLSWEAKGLLAYILSRPDNWSINQKDLIKRSNGGKTKVESALLELLANGYCNWYQERTEDGKFGEWVYDVFERPEFNPNKEECIKLGKERIESRKARVKEKNKRNNKSEEVKQPEVDYPLSDNPKADNPKADNPPYNNNNNNNIDFNNIKEEEEEEKAPENEKKAVSNQKTQSELVKFLMENNVNYENAIIFENRCLELGLVEFDKNTALKSIEWALIQFDKGVCNEPYKYAAGRLQRILDGKLKDVKVKSNVVPLNIAKNKGRNEVIPEWFYNRKEGGGVENAATDLENVDFEKERQKILEKLNQ